MVEKGRLVRPLLRAEVPVVVGVVAAGHALDLVACPVWVFALLLVLASLADAVVDVVFPRHGSDAQRWIGIGLSLAATTAVMYSTGWGPTLVIGYAVAVNDNVRQDGTRAYWPTAVAATACMVVAQGAVQLGIAPSFIPTPEVHGLAVLAMVALLIVTRVLYRSASEKEVLEGELRTRQAHFEKLVANTSDIILVFQADGSIDYASPALERVLGYQHGGMRLGPDQIHPDDLARATAFFAAVRERPDRVSWLEIRIRDVHGDWHWFEVGVTNLLGDPTFRAMIAVLHDVTERKLFEEQLEYQAFHDSLTRLPNRLAFFQRLEDGLSSTARHHSKLAVLFLDLDRFKLVNDSLGHEAGDRLLVEIAERVRRAVRPTDLVARLGGDEFTVLLDEIHHPADAARVAERILAALHDPIRIASHELVVTASVGIAVSDGSHEPNEVVRQADLAMYVAKEKGRSRWEIFDVDHAPEIVERLELEGELWRAIDQGELEVHFQPEIALDGGDVVAFEALVRWRHPERGLLYPPAFVPFAEETSLIVAIDGHVLRESCRHARAWQASRPGHEPVTVSVNLSPRFVRQLDVIEEVASIIRDTGVDPRCVQVEITERLALNHDERTIQTLATLRALGLRVALDDFGTGYSSLSYLKQFPVDVLKLDRSFVESMDTIDTDAAIVQAIVTMGHALGMRITAEGVERAEQAVRLRALGCDSAQGFHWAPALPPEEAERYLQENAGLETADPQVIPLRRRSRGA
ncbi:MAG: EAL domain-containing protein [Acidimicrobiia bacterium]